jgi:hypothetical protein
MQLINVELAIPFTYNVKTLIEGIKGDPLRFADAFRWILGIIGKIQII